MTAMQSSVAASDLCGTLHERSKQNMTAMLSKAANLRLRKEKENFAPSSDPPAKVVTLAALQTSQSQAPVDSDSKPRTAREVVRMETAPPRAREVESATTLKAADVGLHVLHGSLLAPVDSDSRPPTAREVVRRESAPPSARHVSYSPPRELSPKPPLLRKQYIHCRSCDSFGIEPAERPPPLSMVYLGSHEAPVGSDSRPPTVREVSYSPPTKLFPEPPLLSKHSIHHRSCPNTSWEPLSMVVTYPTPTGLPSIPIVVSSSSPTTAICQKPLLSRCATGPALHPSASQPQWRISPALSPAVPPRQPLSPDVSLIGTAIARSPSPVDVSMMGKNPRRSPALVPRKPLSPKRDSCQPPSVKIVSPALAPRTSLPEGLGPPPCRAPPPLRAVVRHRSKERSRDAQEFSRPSQQLQAPLRLNERQPVGEEERQRQEKITRERDITCSSSTACSRMVSSIVPCNQGVVSPNGSFSLTSPEAPKVGQLKRLAECSSASALIGTTTSNGTSPPTLRQRLPGSLEAPIHQRLEPGTGGALQSLRPPARKIRQSTAQGEHNALLPSATPPAAAVNQAMEEVGEKNEKADEEDVAAATRRTIDEAHAQNICSLSLADISGYLHAPEKILQCLGTWMVWMVHRVFLDDPTLEKLDFGSCSMPSSEDEPRLIPKLFRGLAENTHLRELSLRCANLRGEDQAKLIAESLKENATLNVINLESNSFSPSDIEVIFKGLRHNKALKEIRVQDQFCDEQADKTLLEVVNDALSHNQTLEKLGLDLTERHYRDQILKKLIRNTDITRRERVKTGISIAGERAQEKLQKITRKIDAVVEEASQAVCDAQASVDLNACEEMLQAQRRALDEAYQAVTKETNEVRRLDPVVIPEMNRLRNRVFASISNVNQMLQMVA